MISFFTRPVLLPPPSAVVNPGHDSEYPNDDEEVGGEEEDDDELRVLEEMDVGVETTPGTTKEVGAMLGNRLVVGDDDAVGIMEMVGVAT
jgi:hypothetical protein